MRLLAGIGRGAKQEDRQVGDDTLWLEQQEWLKCQGRYTAS